MILVKKNLVYILLLELVPFIVKLKLLLSDILVFFKIFYFWYIYVSEFMRLLLIYVLQIHF